VGSPVGPRLPQLAPGEHRGTAFAISSTHALTAAHCVGDPRTRIVDRGEFRVALRGATRPVVVDRIDFDVDSALLRIDGTDTFSSHLEVLRHDPRCLTWSAHTHPVAHEEGLRLTGHVDDVDGRVGTERAIQLRCDQGGQGALQGSSGAAVCTGDWVFGIVRYGPPDLGQRVIFASPITEIIARLRLDEILPAGPVVYTVDAGAAAEAAIRTPALAADPPAWLTALAKVVDLGSMLTGDELRALRGEASRGAVRGPLLDALREIAQRLLRDRRHAAAGAASVEALLAACTARFDATRGVIRPVVVSHDRTAAEVCRRAVGLDLAALIERHRAVLAEASIPVVRAASTVEIDPEARIEPAGLAALAGHARSMAAELAAAQLQHFGDESRITAGDLLPIPGALVLREVIVPLPTDRACSILVRPCRAGAGRAVALTCPAGHPRSAVIALPEFLAGEAVRWEVVTRDARGKPRRVAAGWIQVAGAGDPRRIAAVLAERSRAERIDELAGAGLWNEVVLELWPRLDDPDVTTDQLELLRQILRNAYDWLRRDIPGWQRLDTCGHALTAVEHRLFSARDQGKAS